MPFVRTVLGDIDAQQLGICYAHEHIIIDPSHATRQDPSFLLDDVDKAIEELIRFRTAGGRAMVDTMPGGAGRNAAKLALVSKACDIHIVCPTGMHLAKYYAPGDPLLDLDESALVAWFIREISVRVEDAGNSTDSNHVRAGVIKVASGRDRLSSREEEVFAAAAAAHVETGCPIITHTEVGTAAMEQIDVFESRGAILSRVTLSHTDRLPDLDLHRSLLRRGVNLEYDSCFRWKVGEGNPSLELVTQLVGEFPDQLMLGMDAARRTYWRSYGGNPGIDFLLLRFVPQLKASGLSEAQIARVFRDNPARAFSFVTDFEFSM